MSMIPNAHIPHAVESRKIRGFTLLELLIAMLILSFSLLALAGLQIKSQQFSNSAYFNTQATFIAHDMLERMRANPAGLSIGSYNLPTATKHDNCYTLTGCVSSDMAENDMYEWAGDSPDSVSKKIPSGVAIVCIDSTFEDGTPTNAACDGTGTIYAIKVWWVDNNAERQRLVTTVAFE